MKANPDKLARFAIKLAAIDGLDRRAFNKAMRVRFPRITDRTLHQAYRDARIWIAIRQVIGRDREHNL